jgi:hypothetical protein
MKTAKAAWTMLVALGVASPAGAQAVLVNECQVIDEPGSYELARNLPGAKGLLAMDPNVGTHDGDCIVITAGRVTLDLAGFTIEGKADSFPGSAGVRNTWFGGITVRNGSIASFGVAVTLNVAIGSGNRIERIFATGNPHGLRGGKNGIVTDNIVRGQGVAGEQGIAANCPSLITRNVSTGHGVSGIGAEDLLIIGGLPSECLFMDNVISIGPALWNDHP